MFWIWFSAGSPVILELHAQFVWLCMVRGRPANAGACACALVWPVGGSSEISHVRGVRERERERVETRRDELSKQQLRRMARLDLGLFRLCAYDWMDQTQTQTQSTICSRGQAASRPVGGRQERGGATRDASHFFLLWFVVCGLWFVVVVMVMVMVMVMIMVVVVVAADQLLIFLAVSCLLSSPHFHLQPPGRGGRYSKSLHNFILVHLPRTSVGFIFVFIFVSPSPTHILRAWPLQRNVLYSTSHTIPAFPPSMHEQ
ncbi:uncharacterized protein PAC_03086 [Phialocephala subalpina]|uniref:Uncharacterized protein n=1 Tax=Phialocephala subalpina TaxID=576137 RepID=A0A1L7WKA5_9HELO|nr:uncharacterized protein PAC_03086 [Phialocephala subalpina]